MADWQSLSLAEQLGNVGSDFERAVRWQQKNNEQLAASALARALEQLDRTLIDPRHAGPRRREIARLRDEVCNELMYVDNADSAAQLRKYFLAFAATTRRQVDL